MGEKERGLQEKEKAMPQVAIDRRILAYQRKQRKEEEGRAASARVKEAERAELERKETRKKEADQKQEKLREEKGEFRKFKPTNKPTLNPRDPEASNGTEWERAKEKAIELQTKKASDAEKGKKKTPPRHRKHQKRYR